MCGLAGLVDRSGRTGEDALGSAVDAMTATLEHRGPDDGGRWTDPLAGVALGARRLAVIDLSSEGHQPMRSASGRYVIAFNGELYNHRGLRRELAPTGPAFRGHSDTEVLLAAIEWWGLEGALQRSNGMFALALWDRERHVLQLARDRLGEKPLYYGWFDRTFAFGSELKALRAYPGFRGQIDRDAVAAFLRYKYVPAPRSIYGGIRKLPPGTVLTVDKDAQSSDPVPYWSVADAVEWGAAEPFTGTPLEAADLLDDLLRDAVRMRMVADVPLGAFLSGGTDSSTVVALMQAQSQRPVRTFTIGFHHQDYDEAQDAARVASHLGTDHTELYVTPDEAMAVIPHLPEVYDEPFGDSSQIPTYLVAQMARRSVTVSLSGDGGDEVFGGYNRHAWGGFVRRFDGMPAGIRQAMAAVLTGVSPAGWDRVLGSVGAALPRRARQRNPGEKLHKLARALTADGPEGRYGALVSHWQDPASVVLGATPAGSLAGADGRVRFDDPARQMMYLDTLTYLPDDILTKLDRATMAVSLEGRAPYLDHRVVEFAWRLPISMKVRQGRGKWVLRQVLDRYVPRRLVERPKMGFGLPIGDWLRGPLRDWAESLLDPGRLAREGYLAPQPIREVWDQHLSGRRNRQYELWDVLMFQAWLEAQGRPA